MQGRRLVRRRPPLSHWLQQHSKGRLLSDADTTGVSSFTCSRHCQAGEALQGELTVKQRRRRRRQTAAVAQRGMRQPSESVYRKAAAAKPRRVRICCGPSLAVWTWRSSSPPSSTWCSRLSSPAAARPPSRFAFLSPHDSHFLRGFRYRTLLNLSSNSRGKVQFTRFIAF